MTRARIIESAAELLQTKGPAAVTTRGVAEAAGVQAPTIYRQFGDNDGLLEAVAEHVMATFVASKAAVVEAASAANVDPVDDLRAGWQNQLEFGLANPAVFRFLNDPDRPHSAAVESGRAVLEARVHRIAAAGRLRVSEPRAVALIHAAGVGAVQTLLAAPRETRDLGLADAIFDAVLAQMLTDAAPQDTGPVATAVAFRALAPDLVVLSEAERALLTDWLDRVIDAG